MNHIPSRSTQEHERGAALIELALTLPVVLLLTLMLIQFGVLAYAGSLAEQAARQGARVGSVAQVNPAGFAVAEAQRVAYTGFSIGHPHVVALALQETKLEDANFPKAEIECGVVARLSQ